MVVPKNILSKKTRQLISRKSLRLVDAKMPYTSFKTFFFLKAYQNPYAKPKPNNKEFMNKSGNGNF